MRCATTCSARSTFGQDGAVSQEGFQARYDAELANEYGNLASRTLNMLERYSDAIVPAVATEAALRAEFAGLFERLDELLSRAELSAALDEIWQRVRRLNRYVEENAPWVLAKDAARAAELAVVLALTGGGPAGCHRGIAAVHALEDRATAGRARLSRSTLAFAAQGRGTRVRRSHPPPGGLIRAA